MSFTIDGSTVEFRREQFEDLVQKAGGFMFRWATSSMWPLRKLMEQRAGGGEMRQALAKMKELPEKAEKYQTAIKYVVYHYPDLINGSVLRAVSNPITAPEDTLANWMMTNNSLRQKLSPPLPDDVGDLIYGTTHGRYAVTHRMSKILICDDFNNCAMIGTGEAFGRDWEGLGSLDATPTRVLQAVEAAANKPVGLGAQAMKTFASGLTKSRYSPEKVFELSKGQLKQDTQMTYADMLVEHKQPSLADQHLWMHARFVRAVRRACKNGIAMVATSPLFRRGRCQVFFMLDTMGDLGRVALKQSVRGDDYVPITSSEMSFCFRYWNHSQVPLRKFVRFFVNGEQVTPPWEGEWSKGDAIGKMVRSNQEAWKRYELYRAIVKPAGEGAFPRTSDEVSVFLDE